MRHIVISPHMDDAVLSAAAFLLRLKAREVDIIVITVFTGFGAGPISWDSRKYLLKSGCLTRNSFARKRREEDRAAMKRLGVDFRHLEYVDGGFRTDPSGRLLYPSHAALFSGEVRSEDGVLMDRLYADIKGISKPSDILCAPLGVGKHADHLIIHRVVGRLGNAAVYWLDQPYAYQSETVLDLSGYRETARIPHDPRKNRVIGCYRSQVNQLYPRGIPSLDEVFYKTARGHR